MQKSVFMRYFYFQKVSYVVENDDFAWKFLSLIHIFLA